VDELSEREALDLLALGAGRVWEGSERKAAVEVCQMLGCLPLALALAGAHLRQNPKLMVAEYRERMLREGALATVNATDLEADDLPTRHAASVEPTALPGGGAAEWQAPPLAAAAPARANVEDREGTFMDTLVGSQIQQLSEALLSAFPEPAALARMVRTGLDETLDAISSAGSLSTVVSDLIEWAEGEGRIADLLDAARMESPDNPELAEVARALAPAAAHPVAATTLRRAVVLTALSLELHAVREQLADLRADLHPAGTVYDVGRLASAGVGADWEVTLVETGAGSLSASLETERAIDHFKPDAVVFVGVAGGLGDVKLGDVVAATKVYGYESGKDTAEGFRPRPELGLSGHALVQRARAEARSGEWISRVTGQPAPGDVEARVGPIAVGDKVLASTASELVAFLRASYRDALAVEMEGHGMMQAARERNVDALVVRGISDVIDRRADSDRTDWKLRAARHAAAFAMQVLARL
jgi:5'-methylthioadenosine/S-adenosylhomocysteine nucleosidase